jgi:hypothetical protein
LPIGCTIFRLSQAGAPAAVIIKELQRLYGILQSYSPTCTPGYTFAQIGDYLNIHYAMASTGGETDHGRTKRESVIAKPHHACPAHPGTQVHPSRGISAEKQLIFPGRKNAFLHLWRPGTHPTGRERRVHKHAQKRLLLPFFTNRLSTPLSDSPLLQAFPKGGLRKCTKDTTHAFGAGAPRWGAVKQSFLRDSFSSGAHEYRLSHGKPEYIVVVISQYFSDNGG